MTKLEKLKDEFIIKNFENLNYINLEKYADIELGWDECYKIMKEENDKLFEALLHYSCSHYGNDGHLCVRDKTAINAIIKNQEFLGE
jgi:hypothetical protein